MFNCIQLRKLVVQPVLNAIYLYSPEAEDLLIGTCAQESRGGTYLFQQGQNPDLYASFKKDILAVGIYQMEPQTHDDLWKNTLKKHSEISSKIITFCNVGSNPSAEIMLYNLYYATAMARVQYYRFNDPIPTTIELQAEYYKKHYNTSNGAATVDEYILNYHHFSGGK